MFWVVQDDMGGRNRRDEVLRTLETFGIPHQAVSIGEGRETVPRVDVTGPVVINGSVLLAEIADDRGWRPGSLKGSSFDCRVWHCHLRDVVLNRDAVFTTVRDADPALPAFFVRPVLDSKSFAGHVATLDGFHAWRLRVLAGTEAHVTPETWIMHAPVQYTGQEHRHFIVEGRVVSSSRYKLAGVVNLSPQVDDAVMSFAEDVARLWQPARAFTLDTYVSGDRLGVVEVGCITHAGFYAADVQSIVMALDAMAWP